LATQKTLNDKSQRKLAEQQTQLDQWRAWTDDQARGQAQQAQYDWRQSNYASGGGQQGEARQYGLSNRGKPGRAPGTHTSSYPQADKTTVVTAATPVGLRGT